MISTFNTKYCVGHYHFHYIYDRFQAFFLYRKIILPEYIFVDIFYHIRYKKSTSIITGAIFMHSFTYLTCSSVSLLLNSPGTSKSASSRIAILRDAFLTLSLNSFVCSDILLFRYTASSL